MDYQQSVFNLCLGSLFLVFLCTLCTACVDEERIALLELKASRRPFSREPYTTWVNDKTSDCCAWERIKCHNSTSRVTQLDLYHLFSEDKPALLNASLFLPFQDLQQLHLASNSIYGWEVNHGIERLSLLKKLAVLDLSGNNLKSNVLVSLSELTSIKTLNLEMNHFGDGEGSSAQVSRGIRSLSKLKKLEFLNLNFNYLSNKVMPLFGSLTTTLSLSYNNISYSEDMAPQGKSDASRIQWNSTMDEHLIGVLKEEHLTGGRHPDGTWKHDALAHAAKEVFDQTGEEVSVEHVRARRRYLQDKYKKARECKEKSGFGWNAATQLFTADSIAWKEFVTEHPKYKSFRSKQVPFYDDLDCIFGEEKVTGLRNFEGSESSAHVEPPLDDCDNGDDNEIQPSTSISSMQTTTSGSRKKRRRMAESMEENMLMGMVEAAKEIAKALKPQKCDHIERALRQLPDMTDDQVFDGMDLLGPDPQLTEVFFGLSEDSSKKAWLMRRLKRQN